MHKDRQVTNKAKGKKKWKSIHIKIFIFVQVYSEAAFACSWRDPYVPFIMIVSVVLSYQISVFICCYQTDIISLLCSGSICISYDLSFNLCFPDCLVNLVLLYIMHQEMQRCFVQKSWLLNAMSVILSSVGYACFIRVLVSYFKSVLLERNLRLHLISVKLQVFYL